MKRWQYESEKANLLSVLQTFYKHNLGRSNQRIHMIRIRQVFFNRKTSYRRKRCKGSVSNDLENNVYYRKPVSNICPKLS